MRGARWPGAVRSGGRRAEVAALTSLAALLLVLLATVPRLANDHVAVAMDRVPGRVALDGFFPVERNAGGAFRWARPDAAVVASAGAPGRYRVVFRLQEGPTGRPPRAVALTLNGRPLASWQLAPEAREFAVTFEIAREEWARDDRLVFGLATPSLTIGGDPRALGPVALGFRLEQVAPPGPWPPAFLIACALVILGGYPLLRLGGLGAGASALALGGLALGGGAYAALDRPGTLRLIYGPLDGAAPLAIAAAALVAAGLVLRAGRLSAGARDALLVAVVMAASIAPYVARLGFYGDDWLFLKYLATAPAQTFGGLWGALWENVPILRQRPVQMAVTIGLYRAYGADPTPYHLANGATLVVAVVGLLLALRALGLPRPVALGVALLYGLLPTYSADRFWLASAMAVQSQAAFHLACWAGVVAVRRGGRAGVGWGALALGALVVGLLAYELVLPTLALVGALLWWRGRRDGRGRAWLTGFLAAGGAAVAMVVAYKARVTIRASLGGTRELLPTIWRQLVRLDYGPSDVGLNARKAVEIGYGDLGLGLPRTAWGLADRYPHGGAIVVALALGLVVAAALGRAHRDLGGGWPPARRWGALALSGAVAFALGYAIFLTNTQIQFALAGIASRTAIAATVGIAASLVGGVGWACLALPVPWRARAWTGVLTLLCASGVVAYATLGEFWAAAAAEQRAVLGAIQRQYPAFPPGAVLLLDGACPYVGPAQVFESAWDLAGALSVVYGDATVRADIVTPRLTLEPGYVATVIYGAIRKEYPYGEGLVVYDYGRGTATPLPDFGAAQRYFARVNPDRSGGCPPGIEGLGVRLLPWASR